MNWGQDQLSKCAIHKVQILKYFADWIGYENSEQYNFQSEFAIFPGQAICGNVWFSQSFTMLDGTCGILNNCVCLSIFDILQKYGKYDKKITTTNKQNIANSWLLPGIE